MASPVPVRVRVTPAHVSLAKSDEQLSLRISASEDRTLPKNYLVDWCRLSHAEVAPKVIADFARAWGPLGLQYRKQDRVPVAWRTEFVERRGSSHESSERVSAWREAAARTAALGRLLAVSSKRNKNWREDPKDWEVAAAPFAASKKQPLRADQRRIRLEELVRAWCDLGGVRRHEQLDPDPFAGVIAAGPIGSSAVVLWLAMGGLVRLGICLHPYCNLPYVQTGWVHSANNTFCPDHAKTGPTLVAKHEQRGAPKRMRKETQG